MSERLLAVDPPHFGQIRRHDAPNQSSSRIGIVECGRNAASVRGDLAHRKCFSETIELGGVTDPYLPSSADGLVVAVEGLVSYDELVALRIHHFSASIHSIAVDANALRLSALANRTSDIFQSRVVDLLLCRMRSHP